MKDEDCDFLSGCTDNGLNLNHAGELNDDNGDGLPAFNYNDQAVVDDGSCEAIIIGCTNQSYFEYNPLANTSSSFFVLLNCARMY